MKGKENLLMLTTKHRRNCTWEKIAQIEGNIFSDDREYTLGLLINVERICQVMVSSGALKDR